MLIELFFLFFMIGLFTFGGGYAMIPLLEHEVITRGFLSEIEFHNMIAISESTPGPIAVNMATFVGYNEAGVIGSLVSTLGVILPSFIIILIIASVFNKLIEKPLVKAILHGFQGIVIGLIFGTGLYYLYGNVFKGTDSHIFDYKSLIIFVVILTIAIVFKKIKKKSISPFIILICSAAMGAIFYFI